MNEKSLLFWLQEKKETYEYLANTSAYANQYNKGYNAGRLFILKELKKFIKGEKP